MWTKWTQCQIIIEPDSFILVTGRLLVVYEGKHPLTKRQIRRRLRCEISVFVNTTHVTEFITRATS